MINFFFKNTCTIGKIKKDHILNWPIELKFESNKYYFKYYLKDLIK